MGGKPIANIFDARRVKAMERAKGAVLIPPFGRVRGKALDFRGIDGGASIRGHVLLPIALL
jgi:hypothetical protein